MVAAAWAIAKKKRSSFCRKSARLKLWEARASMTFSISAAMMLRRVKSGLLKMVRKRRSVSRCWMSISSTAASARLGLMERLASSAKSANAWMKRRLALRSFSMISIRLRASSGTRCVAEEGVESVNEGLRLGEVGVECEGVVLEQESAARALEQNVVAGVAEVELLAGFLGEIVMAVFGFPKPVGEAEVVEQCA